MKEVVAATIEWSGSDGPIAITNIDVLVAMAETNPNENHGAKTHFVKYGEQVYPLKHIVARAIANATGTERRKPHTKIGADLLEELGFQVVEKGRDDTHVEKGESPDALTDILKRMEAVEVGDEILWNGRTVAQPVTKVSETYFEAEGNRGGRYRFFITGSDAPYLTNLNSNNDYSVDEFQIVGRSIE